MRPIVFLLLFSLAQFFILLTFHYFKIQSLITTEFRVSLGIMIGFLAVVYATGLFLYHKYISKVLQYLHFFNITSTVAVVSSVLYSGFIALYAEQPFLTVAGNMMNTVLLSCIFTGAFISAVFSFLMRTMFKDQKKEDILDTDLIGKKGKE